MTPCLLCARSLFVPHRCRMMWPEDRTCTRVWSQPITYLTATPCLKPDEPGFMFGCWSVSIFERSRLCSIVKVFYFRTFHCIRLAKFLGEFDYVCDYRTQSKSIQRLEFDWVRLPNVRLTTPGTCVNMSTEVRGAIKHRISPTTPTPPPAQNTMSYTFHFQHFHTSKNRLVSINFRLAFN